MKKDIEQLKIEIHKELETWYNVDGGLDGDGINEIMFLINQIDEPEVKQLEQRINVLENELKILDSYIDNLKLYHEDEVESLEIELRKRHNKIADVEYELFLEKTRDSKHKFYWFTAKTTPLVSDVSYTNNENDFYGFKQVPKYKIIEKHDLRFVTNCSLDDVIEQFR